MCPQTVRAQVELIGFRHPPQADGGGAERVLSRNLRRLPSAPNPLRSGEQLLLLASQKQYPVEKLRHGGIESIGVAGQGGELRMVLAVLPLTDPALVGADECGHLGLVEVGLLPQLA